MEARCAVKIREATVADAEAIAWVHVRSWRETYAGLVPTEVLTALNEVERAAQWREWLTLGLAVFVAEVEEGAVAGFAGGGPVREPTEGFDGEVYVLYLMRQHHRRGIGRALLEQLLGELRRRGLGGVMAWVLAGNESRGFYERTGAVEVAAKETDVGGAMLPVVAFGWRAGERT